MNFVHGFIKQHPILSALNLISTVSTAALMASCTPPSPAELQLMPTGDLSVKTKESTLYCSMDGHRGTEFFKEGDILRVIFKKNADQVHGDLEYKTPRHLYNSKAMREGTQMMYDFDSLGTINAAITTQNGDIFYGFRGDNYTYLQEDIQFSIQKCEMYIKRYMQP
ncbi:MAG TPA: hypothetical protein DCM27_00980 [Rhodospirillaceae bacterium]|nr:hypothetical protein [Rhodospirillaceae bacterium]